jgi:hypothetical protein
MVAADASPIAPITLSNSARRLAELMALPPAKRVRHLNDPALEPADRERLRDGIGTTLRRTRLRRVSRSPTRIVGFMGSRWTWRLLVLTILLAIPVTGLVIGWSRTGERWALLTVPVAGAVTAPDGTVLQHRFEPETWFVVESSVGGVAAVRLWQDQVGYYRTTVPIGVLR